MGNLVAVEFPGIPAIAQHHNAICQFLHFTQPDSTFLFFGVQGAEEAEAFRAKYQTRVASVMILVLRLMAMGFPEGAGALPTTWDSRPVDLDRSRFEISARTFPPSASRTALWLRWNASIAASRYWGTKFCIEFP